MSLSRIAVLAESFAVPSPAQQLLDRLLAGYPRDGTFRPPVARSIRLCCPTAPIEDIDRRTRDFHLEAAATPTDALQGAEAALVVGAGPNQVAAPETLMTALQLLPEGGPCFVLGLLGPTPEDADRAAALARKRRIRLTAATPTATTVRLPELRLRPGQRIAEALIVVQGTPAQGLLDGVDGLLTQLESGGVRFEPRPELRVETFRGDEAWRALERGRWPGDLLAAALSRTDNPQGDPVKDGRTQDLYGLGLVPGLSRDPQVWVTHHPKGARTTIALLNGVVTDLNLALRTAGGDIVSTQLYRPPAPGQHAYDPLAAVIDDLFHGLQSPWSSERAQRATAWYAALSLANGG